jgi:protein-tyrosine phosphatase
MSAAKISTMTSSNHMRGQGRIVRRRMRGWRVLASVGFGAGRSVFLFGCSGSNASSPPSSSGGVPFTAATVTGSESAWTVSWVAPGTKGVRVFEGPSATDATTVVGTGRSSGTLTAAGSPGVAREWFRLVPSSGQSLVLADRDLGLTSDPNLRDIGGYRTTSGDWVRMGVVYRSEALSSLSATDLSVVDQLGITDIYDLRTPDEASGAPDASIPDASYHLLNVFGTPGPTLDVGTTPATAQQSMIEMNDQFVTGSADRAALRQLMTGIADSTGAQLFKCTAGKDRTGWATAVILSVLGVSESTVMHDYLLSNTYYFDSPAVQASIKSASPSEAATLSSVLGVNAEYLQAGLNQITTSYGSVYNYVVHGLGVSPTTVSKLRDRLLVT